VHYFRYGEFLSVNIRDPVSKDRSYKYSRLMAEMVEEVMDAKKSIMKVG
jgi:ubiquitin C-terminal hydrolase